MAEFLYFLGRFHVLLLHLPIGILLLAVVLEALSRGERFRGLASSLNVVWALGAATAIATVVLGYLHASEGGFDSAAVNAHRLTGTSLAVVAVIIALVRARFAGVYARVWAVGAVAIVALLFATGHFGGNLTHGDTYLTQYAPAPLHDLMGVPEEQVARAAPKDLASADLYLDVVAPAFRQRCSSCHNESKRKGGLSLATYAALMKGGEHGVVILAGQPDKSDLVRRISLSHDSSDFMPRDGKTPLTAEQTAAIRWWVAVGAPRKGTVQALNPAPEVLASIEVSPGLRASNPALADTLGEAMHESGGNPEPDEPADDAVNVPPAAVAALDDLERKGFAVRAISAGSPLLQADYTTSRPLTDDDMAALSEIAPQLRILNLRNAGTTDAQLKAIGTFENLTRLRLELNPVTDAGLAALSGLRKLEYLNLYGTRITNAGLLSLGSLPRLREVFVWQTQVTPAAIAEFERAHTQVKVVQGFDAKGFPDAPKVIPVVN